MNQPVEPFTCPMCGQIVTTVGKRCTACEKVSVTQSGQIDQAIAILSGMLSAVTCVYWIDHGLRNFSHPRSITGEAAIVVAFCITIVLWGLPLATTLIARLLRKRRFDFSLWRVFWRTQATMYAISLGLWILCLSVCTQTGR